MRLNLLLVVFGVVCYLAVAGAALAGIWRPMGPYGDMVSGMAMAPGDPAVLFASCNGGLFKSVNGGASWDRVGKAYGISSTFSVSAARSGRDLVIAENGFYLYLSTDGGVSWKQTVIPGAAAGARINSVAIDPRNPELVWACTNNGPCCSYDSGNDWVLRADGLPADFDARFVRFDMADPSGTGLYLCGSHQGIYRYDAFACTWAPVGSLQYVPINDLAPAPQDADTLYACPHHLGVFKTTDGGATWTAKNAGLGELEARLMAISPSDPNVLYCAVGAHLYVSEDGAESWQRRDEGASVGSHASSLIASPVSTDMAYVGTRFGVYETIDRGVSWDAANRGILSASVTDMAFHPSLPGAIFVVTQVAFFRTTDNGRSWDVLSMEGDPTKCASVTAVALDPQEPSTIYAGAFWTYKSRIIKSVDAGDTWAQVSELSEDHWEILALAIDPSDPQTIYLGTGRGEVLKSQDGGCTWADTGYPGGADIGAAVIDPKDSSVLWVGTWTMGGGGAYRSRDGGASWDKIVDGATCAMAVSPATPDTVYIGGPDGLVIARSDGGGGYIFQEDQPGLLDQWVNSMDISPGNPDVVYLGTGAMGLTSLFAGVYKTTNGGESWRQLPCEGMVGKRCGYVAADPYIPTEVWAGFDANALLKYSEEAGPPIQVSLSTDQSQYAAGDIHVARISAANSGGDINVDLYIAIMLPDGSLLFWPDLSSLMHPGFSMTPMPRGFSMTDVMLFSMALPDSLPGGNYTWFGMFYGQGAQNPVSNLASAGWTFQPQH